MQPVTVAVLQIRELKNKQVTSFPKVTLTASEEVGEKAQHILRAVVSALGGTAHGRKDAGARGILVYCVGYWFLPGRLALRLYSHLHQVSNARMLPLLLLTWESLLCGSSECWKCFLSPIQPHHVHGQGKPPVAFHRHTHTQLPCLPLQVQLRILFPRNPSLLTWTIGWVWEAEGKRGTFKWRGAERSLFPAGGCAHSMQQ